MRVIYASFIMNAVALLLKAITMYTSNSSAVNAEFMHALGDFVGSGLLALGVLIMSRKPSIRYPFGFGRSIYVFGLISAAIVGGFLSSISMTQGLMKLYTLQPVESSVESEASLILATIADLLVLTWALREFRLVPEDPSVKGTIVENVADGFGDVAALIALITKNPFVDAYGALIISGILLLSAVNLGHKYFNVLIGRAAPKNVVGRAIKVAVSLPLVIDVNDVKSLVIGPNEYLLIMQVEVPPDLSAEEIEELRNELKERLMVAEPNIKYLIVEFVTPKEPPASFKKLLTEIISLGD